MPVGVFSVMQTSNKGSQLPCCPLRLLPTSIPLFFLFSESRRAGGNGGGSGVRRDKPLGLGISHIRPRLAANGRLSAHPASVSKAVSRVSVGHTDAAVLL